MNKKNLYVNFIGYCDDLSTKSFIIKVIQEKLPNVNITFELGQNINKTIYCNQADIVLFVYNYQSINFTSLKDNRLFYNDLLLLSSFKEKSIILDITEYEYDIFIANDDLINFIESNKIDDYFTSYIAVCNHINDIFNSFKSMETSINILDEHNEHGEYDENEIINYIKNYYPDYVLEAANKYLNKNLKPSEILYCAKVDSGYQDKIKTIREKHRKNFQLKLAKIKAMD